MWQRDDASGAFPEGTGAAGGVYIYRCEGVCVWREEADVGMRR